MTLHHPLLALASALLLLLALGCDNDTTYSAEVTTEVDDTATGTSGGQSDASSDDGTEDTTLTPDIETSTSDTAPSQDTASPQDTATPQDTAVTQDTAVMPDAPPASGQTTIRITNAGEVAAYMEPVFREASWRGLTLYRVDANGERRRLSLGPVCSLPCSNECMPIACEPPTPASFQLLPGASWEFEWDGEYIETDTCIYDDGPWSCYNTRQATAGEIIAEVCYAATFEALGDSVRRDLFAEDVLEATQWIDPVCVEQTFVFSDAATEVELVVSPEATQEDKPFGFCGPAWTWSWNSPPDAVRVVGQSQEGASVPFTSGSFGGPVNRCLAPGYTTEPQVNPDSVVLFDVLATTWTGTRPCDDSEPRGNVHLIRPEQLPDDPGNAALQISGDQGGPREAVMSASCERCTEEAPTQQLGEPCLGDSACADEGAFCDLRTATACNQLGICEGECTLDCRSNRDCPGNTRCEPVPESAQIVGRRCTPQLEEGCRFDYGCPPGQRCVSDSNAFSRCLPDMDTRGLVNGRGALCGCDAECPGAQSCVRMEFNFTDGFCAFRCRDARDCPEGWSCLGETSSGLGSICFPSD